MRACPPVAEKMPLAYLSLLDGLEPAAFSRDIVTISRGEYSPATSAGAGQYFIGLLTSS